LTKSYIYQSTFLQLLFFTKTQHTSICQT